MTDINQLLDELQDLVDDKLARVAKLFADIRAAVPKPMTLVFSHHALSCVTPVGKYSYWTNETSDKWCWYCIQAVTTVGHGTEESEPDVVAAMQSHFDAAWSAMTAKGAAT